MSKIRTLNDLQDRLDREFSWRRKELASLKTIVKGTAEAAKKTAIRSAVCLGYAHWEGFVKLAAEFYIEYVSNQGLRYNQLADCFVVIGAKRHLASFLADGKIAAATSGVQFFRHYQNRKAYLRLPGHVKTRSNLNSEVFENIAQTIGVSTVDFEARYNQIDQSLVRRRNRIAHGEYLDLDMEPCLKLIDDVIYLLDQFKRKIEIASSNESFRLAVDNEAS